MGEQDISSETGPPLDYLPTRNQINLTTEINCNTATKNFLAAHGELEDTTETCKSPITGEHLLSVHHEPK